MSKISNRLLLVDLDGSLLLGNSLVIYLKFAGGMKILVLGLPRLLVNWIALIFKGNWKSWHFKEALLRTYLKGRSRENLESLGEACVKQSMIPHLNQEVLTRLNAADFENSTVVVVTASLDIWVKPLAQILGVQILCTEAEYDATDAFTGRFATPNCKNEEKKRRVLEVYNLEAYTSVVAIGNSKGDAAMFELADEIWWVKSDGRLVCLKKAE